MSTFPKLLLFAVLLIAVPQVAPAVTVGDGKNPATCRNNPNATLSFTNRTRRDAKDLHFRVRAREGWIDMDGISVQTDAFRGGGTTQPSDNSRVVTLNAGTVARNQKIVLKVAVCLSDKNQVFVDAWQWSFDGNLSAGENGAREGLFIGNGFSVDRPQYDPNLNQWRHKIEILNLESHDAYLDGIAFLFGARNVADKSALDWASAVSPFAMPVLVPGLGALEYTMTSAAPLFGESLYMRYTYATTAGTGDETQVFGEHPILVPLPAAVFSYAGALLVAGAMGLSRRRRSAAPGSRHRYKSVVGAG